MKKMGNFIDVDVVEVDVEQNVDLLALVLFSAGSVLTGPGLLSLTIYPGNSYYY